MRAFSCALLFLLCSSACESDESFVAVELMTDFVSQRDFDSVRVSLTPPGGESRALTLDAAIEDYSLGVRLATFDNVTEPLLDLSVELLQRGIRVAERTYRFAHTGSEVRRVVLWTRCRGVSCPRNGDSADATECRAGGCVSPECSEANVAACPEGDCRENSDCPDLGLECASAVCVEGVCFMQTDSGVCEGSEFCSTSGHCERISGAGMDAGIDAGRFDVGPDVPTDAQPEECGQACEIGDACELGVFNCESGTPVCESAGPALSGTPCRDADGLCDLPDVCDGVSLSCANIRRAAGEVCRASSGECDAEEVCDGVSDVCPSDENEPIGTSCSSGACDQNGICSSSCQPGAPCTPAPCRVGRIDCMSGTPVCVSTANAPDGATCPANPPTPWSGCLYENVCATTGSESRQVFTAQCAAGVCTMSASEERRPCSRTTDGIACSPTEYGPWSCREPVNLCDESRDRFRSVTTHTCGSGSCGSTMTEETVRNSPMCQRDTDGMSCATEFSCDQSTCSSGVCNQATSCGPNELCCESGCMLSGSITELCLAPEE